MNEPRPVAAGERLPQPIEACELLCRRCRIGLYYQMRMSPKYEVDFFWCRRCGTRYAAASTWSPGTSPDR